jgi:hypothetical protein
MGEIADQIIDEILDRHMFIGRGPRRNNPQRGVGKGRWMSSAGPMEMTEMTDIHIANALAMCELHGNTGKARELRAEQKRRDLLKPKLIEGKRGFF